MVKRAALAHSLTLQRVDVLMDMFEYKQVTLAEIAVERRLQVTYMDYSVACQQLSYLHRLDFKVLWRSKNSLPHHRNFAISRDCLRRHLFFRWKSLFRPL